jgi:uncharacterized protein (DUF433 family)
VECGCLTARAIQDGDVAAIRQIGLGSRSGNPLQMRALPLPVFAGSGSDRLDACLPVRRCPDLAKIRFMNTLSSVIVREPEIMGGTPCFRGTRVPLRNLMDYIEGGYPLAEFLEDFPSVSRAMAIQALEDAQESLLSRIA